MGMKDVKKQILEFIAVGKLKDDDKSDIETKKVNEKGEKEGNEATSSSITNKVLCLIGPPG